MKKTLIIFLSLVLMLTFAACGEKNGGKSNRAKASLLTEKWQS